MTGETISLITDGLIILLLAGTIFYALRLSAHIKAFRDSRKDIEKLLGDLAAHIGKAEQAVEGLRAGARQSGRDLQALINEARGLSEELQIMSQSGNSLAGRLEKLADGSSRTVQEKRGPASFDPPLRPRKMPAKIEADTEEAFSPFNIRDPEFDEDIDGGMNADGLLPGDYDEEEQSGGGFASQAERDLYEALRGRKKTEAGGVS
jgi:hypothetical protein